MRKIRVDEHTYITLILQFAQRACPKSIFYLWRRVKCCWKNQLWCPHWEYLFQCWLDPKIEQNFLFSLPVPKTIVCAGGLGYKMSFSLVPKPLGSHTALFILVRVFFDVLVAFLYFDICHYEMNTSSICQHFWKKYSIFDRWRKLLIFVIGVTLMLVANIKILKSHLNIREGSDYIHSNAYERGDYWDD